LDVAAARVADSQKSPALLELPPLPADPLDFRQTGPNRDLLEGTPIPAIPVG
jgi:hypothetical protein